MSTMLDDRAAAAATGAASGDPQVFDLAIIGGGIGGAMLASAMARHGVSVLVLEAGTHPKFAIGESMILETSEIMRSLAAMFDVPELEYFSSEYFSPEIGGAHGVKRHFSYLPHKEGEPARAENLIQAVIPEHPYGHETHIYRQDSDYFYLATAVKYGATVRQRRLVADVLIDKAGAKLAVKVEGGGAETYRARYVADAGGFRSVLADKYGLRRKDLKTATRGLFTHMTGVRSYHERDLSAAEMGAPFSLAEGTLHHVFEGGWLWVIPFNNHPCSTNDLCSVGLLLDPRIHGPAPDLPPDEEFWRFVARYPSIARHLEGARAVRDWTRAESLQYASREIVGDRFALIGHAAGFIDPLFSKGLYTTLAAVMTFGQIFLAARENGDFSRERFLPLERQTLAFVAANDRLVANAIKSFARPELWRVYSVIWILGAYLELVRLTTFRMALLKRPAGAARRSVSPPPLALVGGGYAPFLALADDVDQQIEALDLNDDLATAACVDAMRRRLRAETWIPLGHRAIAEGARALPRRKFTWRLFAAKGGVLGAPDYRRHFFYDTNLFKLGLFLLKDRIRYSRTAIARRHRRRRRREI